MARQGDVLERLEPGPTLTPAVPRQGPHQIDAVRPEQHLVEHPVHNHAAVDS